MNEPAVLFEFSVEAALGSEARPDADHGFETHVVKLLVHGRWVWPELRIHVHLAHFGVVEPVDDHDVGGQMAVAISLGDGEDFFLAGVALLALDVSVGGLGQQRGGAGEKTIAGIDFVGGVAGDDEEGDAVADLRCPLGLFVEAGFDGGFGWIVPDEAVAFVRDEERDAGGGRSGREVIVPAADGMAAMIEETFVVVAEAVVVLVVRRDEGGADGEELGVGGAAVVIDVGGAVFVIGDGLLPAGHFEELLAFGSGEGDVRAGGGAVEEFRDVEFG